MAFQFSVSMNAISDEEFTEVEGRPGLVMRVVMRAGIGKINQVRCRSSKLLDITDRMKMAADFAAEKQHQQDLKCNKHTPMQKLALRLYVYAHKICSTLLAPIPEPREFSRKYYTDCNMLPFAKLPLFCYSPYQTIV